MATEFEIPAPTLRTCAASGRELRAGERVYGVLFDEGGKFVRKDFAADSWTGPPEGAVAYWSGRIPSSERVRKPTFNEDLLLDCFAHLAGNPDPHRAHFRYVVALLLMRRKRLKFEDAKKAPDGTPILVVRDAKGGAKHEIVDPRLSEAEISAVQDEVFKVLGWD